MASYRAKATTVGNSKALRFDRALFRAHPEFASGEFKVSVLGPGADISCVTIAEMQGRLFRVTVKGMIGAEPGET